MTDREEVMVYKLDRDIEQVLHNIINAWNNNKDYKQRWNMNPKEQVWVNIRVQGDHLELRVEALKGGWRESNRFDIVEMQRFAEDVRKALVQAEKDLRKEFKEKTGKAFRWSKGKVSCRYEPVALNGLYKFYATKGGQIKVNLPRQEHSEGVKGPNPGGKNRKADDWKLADILSLPERWR